MPSLAGSSDREIKKEVKEMHTKEDWRVEDRWNVMSGRRVVANCGGYSSNAESVVDENEANAHLIVAAVNACIKVNPDNPQAAAKSIPDLYEVLEVVLNNLDDGFASRNLSLKTMMREVLAKAKAEK